MSAFLFKEMIEDGIFRSDSPGGYILHVLPKVLDELVACHAAQAPSSQDFPFAGHHFGIFLCEVMLGYQKLFDVGTDFCW